MPIQVIEEKISTLREIRAEITAGGVDRRTQKDLTRRLERCVSQVGEYRYVRRVLIKRHRVYRPCCLVAVVCCDTREIARPAVVTRTRRVRVWAESYRALLAIARFVFRHVHDPLASREMHAGTKIGLERGDFQAPPRCPRLMT